MEPNLERIVARLPDPESARRFAARLEAEQPRRFASLVRRPARLANLLTLAAYSPWLGDALLRDPDGPDWPAEQTDLARAYAKEDMLESLARLALRRASASEHELLTAFKRRELARIYLRDCLGIATLTETTEELSHLADAIVERALVRVRQDLVNRFGVPLTRDARGRIVEAEFAVVALGKLGSFELNYASDIDLMFLYAGTGETAPTTRGVSSRTIDNHSFFARLAEALVKVVGSSEQGTAIYRIDLRLRPYGREGDIAIRCERAVTYYEKLAENWERQMLIRARCSAGDRALVDRFQAAVRDVVYQQEPAAEVLLDVREAKEKIDRKELARDGGFDVKLGLGGIREIEFIVQALQRAHGGRDPWVRAPRVLVGLQRLADKGLLGDTDRSALSDAYTFLRTVEHRIQMAQGVQTHRLPVDPVALETLARRCGYGQSDALVDDLRRHTSRVRAIWRRVLGEGRESKAVAAEKPAAMPPPPGGEAEPTLAPDAAHALGGAARSLAIFDAGARAPSDERVSAWRATLAETAALVPNPARALRNLDRYLASLATCDDEVRARALGGGEEKVARLLQLLGSGKTFTDMLAAQPGLGGEIPGGDLVSAVETRESFRDRLAASVAAESALPARMAALRRAWYREMVAVGSHDVIGRVGLGATNREQTALAEASLDVACRIALDELAAGDERDPDPRFAIQALGRLGHSGVDYDSDLDLIVVYDPDAPSPIARLEVERLYPRLAELLMRILSSLTREGMLYRVDYRLRPDGRDGLLASTLDRITSYVRTRAASWELTAYLKVRAAAGDAEFGRSARDAIVRAVFEASRAKESLKEEVRAMRMQVERERGRKGRNIKWGPGGMMDVYFATRYLQLRDEADFPPEQGTVALVRHLERIGSLDPASASDFAEGYGLLRQLDHYIRLVGDRHAPGMSEAPEFAEEAAAVTGFASREAFESALSGAMVRIRTSFDRVFGA